MSPRIPSEVQGAGGGRLEEGAKSKEGSSRRQWKTSLPPNSLAWEGLGNAGSPPSPGPCRGASHLQDEDDDEGDGENDHHLDKLAVSHTLLAREVILQQIWEPH